MAVGWNGSALAMATVVTARSFLEFGTTSYAPKEKRRLMCVNAAAHSATVVGIVLFVNYLFNDPLLFRWVLAVNAVMLAVSLSIPFLHRFGPNVGSIVLISFAYLNLFAVVAMLGRDSGLHLLIFAPPAAMFVMFDLVERLGLAISAIAVGLVIYLVAQWAFPVGLIGTVVSDSFLFRIHVISSVGLVFVVASVLFFMLWLNRQAEERVEGLMRRTFPESVAQRLMNEPDRLIADQVAEASVLFSDLRGFVPLSHALGARRTVEMLNHLVRGFDHLAAENGVERVKTIGDAYMAVAGVPDAASDHAQRMARFALSLQDALRATNERFGVDLKLRVGVASGEVTAGVIGTQRFSYDVWGDAVNLASRLESLGEPGIVHASKDFYDKARATFRFEPRGTVDIKGIGRQETWTLAG